jgi:uncharacterized damage-inducible protein DinB
MRPEDAKVIADFLTGNVEWEIGTTVRVLEAVPGDRLDYRPDPVSKTALGLVRHLVLEDEWILNAVADGQFVPAPDDSDACGIMTVEDAVAQYKARVPAALARVKALAPEALVRQVDLGGMVQLPAVGFVSLMLSHNAHHRGQLSSYLRAMGGKVPGIYGPSADTMAAVSA